jgi:hypothetical protein
VVIVSDVVGCVGLVDEGSLLMLAFVTDVTADPVLIESLVPSESTSVSVPVCTEGESGEKQPYAKNAQAQAKCFKLMDSPAVSIGDGRGRRRASVRDTIPDKPGES